MGDASEVQGDVKAQVLKVAHHGSAVGTSSGFLSHVSPKTAIIEVFVNINYTNKKRVKICFIEVIYSIVS